ncbi:hypothetical protein [Bradyrhizobium elkanii]|uniref:hypothetical protein n=1 Tax=Bradyrhizobium elkanii TaxID=29448 RepID=UPI00114D32E0|nr:hypothetical protein [Bradyrhizobium elkanii]
MSYLVWGLMHGVLLAIERPFVDRLDGLKSPAIQVFRAGGGLPHHLDALDIFQAARLQPRS